MRNVRTGAIKATEQIVGTPGEVLIDVGTALVAFGEALQLAGARLQSYQPPPAVPPQVPAITVPLSCRLPPEGCVRLWDIIGRRAEKGRPAIAGVIPVSSATWYAGVKTGRFPKPIKTGGINLWRVEDIRALVSRLGR